MCVSVLLQLHGRFRPLTCTVRFSTLTVFYRVAKMREIALDDFSLLATEV